MRRKPYRPALLLLALSAAAPSAHGEETRVDRDRGYLPADLPLPPVPARAGEPKGPQLRPIVQRGVLTADGAVQPLSGALSGKSVYLSPGHGWIDTGGWTTQRPNSFSLVEDLSNGDGVSQFLVPLLLGAGALVQPLREIDPQSAMVVLDDSDGTAHPARGLYKESGDLSVFLNSTLDGWGHPPLPLAGDVNPFELGGNRLIWTSPTETARATFVLNVPQAGHYYVYIAYSMYSGRAPDAEVRVKHQGGVTPFLVDQRRQGGSWVLLGRFYFAKGTSEAQGAVVFSNRSAVPGTTVSVDAVRLGGGMGLIDRGNGVSGQPRADECGRYHAQYDGAPDTVWNPSSGSDQVDDPASRARLADWLHAPGEPAVYLSHHSNAFDGSLRGSETYVYGTNPPNGSFKPTPLTKTLGSDKLAQALQSRLVSQLQAGYDPGWTDRQVRSAYFGELNTGNQDEMPAALVEVAFHDNPQDAAALREAGWRWLAARALYKGVVDHFAAVDGVQPVYAPDPPLQVTARVKGPTSVVLSWKPPASGGIHGGAAQSYRVYRSATGRGFDNGTDSAGKTSLTLGGLKPWQPLFLRVTAVNDGGESLPSMTLAVRPGSQPRILLVAGFERWDEPLNVKQSSPALGVYQRLLRDQINDGSYLVPHAAALGATKQAFDACTHDAASAALLGQYDLVIWQAGQGLSAGRALSVSARAALAQAAQSGTSLVISGSTVASTLAGPQASAADQAFLSATLHAGLVKAGGVASPLTPAGLLAQLAPWQLAGPYTLAAVDRLQPVAGSVPLASYPGGAVAALAHLGGGTCRVLLGFPLETVAPAARQAEILAQLLPACLPSPVNPDGGGPPDARLPTPPIDAGPMWKLGYRILLGRDAAVDAEGPRADAGPSPDLGPDPAGGAGCSCRAVPLSDPWPTLGLLLLGLCGRLISSRKE